MIFCRVTLLFGLLIVGLGQALGQVERYEFSRPLMGMGFRIVVYAEAKPLAKRVSDAAFDRVAVLNNIMSDYDPESELSKLSDLPECLENTFVLSHIKAKMLLLVALFIN